MNLSILLLPVTLFSFLTLAQSNEDLCRFQDTCERCLNVDYNCAWCIDKTYQLDSRCLTRDDLISSGCSESSIIVNHQELELVSDDVLKDFDVKSGRAVHLKPQKIKMKVVKSRTQQIKLTYRPARNNPLDLYYLMDLTYTMRDDKDTLVSMGEQISSALRNLTDNYRIGFGSFADKPAMPVVMPNLKENPCATEGDICEPTYSFKHRIVLTQDTDMFVRSVNQSGITANLDNVEGGADALMQVIVCPEAVRWMDQARKIVVLATDGYMHFAGDGLLLGATLRNDRQCHLDLGGEYTESLVYDYPSLEELYRELQRRKISVIFAVTSEVYESYRQISNLMEGISNVEKLSSDSSNILELIRISYELFLRRVSLHDDSPPYIDVTYETTCGGQFDKPLKRKSCSNLTMDQEVEFLVSVTVLDFPPDGQFRQRIRIGESTLSESLDLDVEIQKPCPCGEEVASDNLSRSKCAHHGAMHCGMCSCDKGWGGRLCNCNLENETIAQDIERKCQRPLSMKTDELGPICSFNGRCDCGVCECFSGYTGQFCECPECRNCDPKVADCHCGKCVCRYGWNGKEQLCNCEPSEADCMGPDGQVCSKNGICYCGKCECDKGYSGVYCEASQRNLVNGLCDFYAECVRCYIQKEVNNVDCDSVCSSSEQQTYKFVFSQNEITEGFICLVGDSISGCNYSFKYEWLSPTETQLMLWKHDCFEISEAATAALIALLTIIIGLTIIVLYVWRIRCLDAREVARFEKLISGEKSNSNPLYKDPISKYDVPRGEDDESVDF